MSNLGFREQIAQVLLPCLSFTVVFFSYSFTHAGIVLDTLGQQNWDRSANPGGFQITFAISPNDQPPIANLLSTFSIGLLIVPDSTINGTLRIQSVSVPTNALFAQYGQLRLLGGATQIVDGENNQTVPSGNGVVPANVVLQSQRNIFTALIASPNNDAIGGFKVFAIPDVTTYFTETTFDGEKFSNAPEGGAPVLLGSFNVTAVPEPSSLLLTSLVAGGLATLRYRLKRRQANSLRIL